MGYRCNAIIEARISSTRLFKKVLMPICGKPALHLLIERVEQSSAIDKVIVATTTEDEDEEIAKAVSNWGTAVYRGSRDDVMSRVLEAAKAYETDIIVGLTGDNLLIDGHLIDAVVEFLLKGKYDYVTTTHMHHSKKWDAERTFPPGITVQALWRRVLEEVNREDFEPRLREYSTFRVYDQPERFRLGAFQCQGKFETFNRPQYRLTMDTPEDFEVVSMVFEQFYPTNPLFSSAEVIHWLDKNPEIVSINRHVQPRIVSQRTNLTR